MFSRSKPSQTVRHRFPAFRPRSPIPPASSSTEQPHFDLARPGYALYGGNPTPDRANPMRAVVGLEGRIAQLRWVEAGYGRL